MPQGKTGELAAMPGDSVARPPRRKMNQFKESIVAQPQVQSTPDSPLR
jgi:hypothetical protein